MSLPTLSVAVLTFNRWPVLRELLEQLCRALPEEVELTVVDNGSTEPRGEALPQAFPRVRFIRLPENIGAAGRNAGLQAASGQVVVTLDDDVFGLEAAHLSAIAEAFAQRPRLAALCFKVVNYHDGRLCNWCHPYDPERFAEEGFETCEITEGAVAYRRSVLDEVGFYPQHYFLSNEGADLACRIIDAGYEIHYTPGVVLRHRHAPQARPNWRRYYYDTRNHFFLAVRNFRPLHALAYICTKSLVMLVYSLRDGFFRYWLKGVGDALGAMPRLLAERSPISKESERRLKSLRRHRAPFLRVARQRLGLRKVRI